MFTVQLLNPVSEKGLMHFPPESYHIEKNPVHPDAILLRSFSMHDFPLPDSLLVVGRAGTGVNNIPVEQLTAQGIPVLNTPGANTNAVRELVIAGMLLASRHLCEATAWVHGLSADTDAMLASLVENNKKKFAGTELRAKTLGVIGLGNIGVQVASAAAGLGMSVLGHDPAITVERAWALPAEVRQAKTLDEILGRSDYITLHVPLLAETAGMINAEKLAHLKQGAVLLNFSRHDIVEDAAIAEALETGRLSGYVTDFPSLALQQHPRVISLPHLGASTREAEENCALMIVQAVRAFLERGAILHAVNFPTIDLPLTPGGFRLAMVHHNMPGMVAQLSRCLAEKSINIIGLQNGSQGHTAYTLTDVGTAPSDALITALAAIPGMIRVRQVQ